MEQLKSREEGYTDPDGKRGNFVRLEQKGNGQKATIGNNHPTVKPVALMSYLIKLVTPPGGLVIDPFCGSGSTGMAAVELGFDFIGMDLDPTYCEITEMRIEGWKNKLENS